MPISLRQNPEAQWGKSHWGSERIVLVMFGSYFLSPFIWKSQRKRNIIIFVLPMGKLRQRTVTCPETSQKVCSKEMLLCWAYTHFDSHLGACWLSAALWCEPGGFFGLQSWCGFHGDIMFWNNIFFSDLVIWTQGKLLLITRASAELKTFPQTISFLCLKQSRYGWQRGELALGTEGRWDGSRHGAWTCFPGVTVVLPQPFPLLLIANGTFLLSE